MIQSIVSDTGNVYWEKYHIYLSLIARCTQGKVGWGGKLGKSSTKQKYMKPKGTYCIIPTTVYAKFIKKPQVTNSVDFQLLCAVQF